MEANFSPLLGEVGEDERDKADRDDAHHDPDAARLGVSEWRRGRETDHQRRPLDLSTFPSFCGSVTEPLAIAIMFDSCWLWPMASVSASSGCGCGCGNRVAAAG